MMFVLMLIAWVVGLIALSAKGSAGLWASAFLIAALLTIAVLIRFQENLYLREELRKKIVDLRNDLINLFMKYMAARHVHLSVDGKDRETVREIVNNLFKGMSWLWQGSPMYPSGVLVSPTTDQEVVERLDELYDHLKVEMDEYNNSVLVLRKKALSILWYFVYSNKGFEYLDKVSFDKVAKKMVEDAADSI